MAIRKNTDVGDVLEVATGLRGILVIGAFIVFSIGALIFISSSVYSYRSAHDAAELKAKLEKLNRDHPLVPLIPFDQDEKASTVVPGAPPFLHHSQADCPSGSHYLAAEDRCTP